MNFLNRLKLSFSRNAPQGAAAPLASAARPLPYSRLTLADWCASPERVSYVTELLRQPLFLDLVGMLSNVRLHHRGPMDATTAARLLGQREGHDLILASLLAAGTPAPAPPVDVPADYGAENAMAAWEAEGTL